MRDQQEKTSQNQKPLLKAVRKIFSISIKLTMVTLLGIFILVLLLHIPSIQKKSVDLVLNKLADSIDKRIECEFFHISLLGTLEIKNLVVYHNPKFGSEPLGTIEHLYAVFNPLSIAGEKFHIRELTIDNTEFRIIYTPEKISNLHRDDYVKKDKKRKTDDSNFQRIYNQFQLDHLVLNQVYFELDYQPTNYYLEVPFFNLEGTYDPQENVLKTILSSQCVDNRIPEKLNFRGDTVIQGKVWAGGVKNGLIQINSNSGRVWLQGLCNLTNFYQPTLDFSGSALVDLNEISPLAELSNHLAGDAIVTFKGKGLAEDLLISANFDGSDIEFSKFRVASIRGNARYYDQQIDIVKSHGSAYDGQVNGDGFIRFGNNNKHLNLTIGVDNANLAILCKDLNVPFLLESSCDTTLSIKGDGFKTTDMQISGIATGTQLTQDVSVDPLTLFGEFQMIDGIFAIPSGRLENPDHSITLQNGVFDKLCLQGNISGISHDLNDLIHVVKMLYGKDFSVPPINGSGQVNLDLSGNFENYLIAADFDGNTVYLNNLPSGDVNFKTEIIPGKVKIFDAMVSIPDFQASGDITVNVPINQASQVSMENYDISVQNLNLAYLDSLTNQTLHLHGNATGHVTTKNNPDQADTNSWVKITNAVYYDIPLGDIDMNAAIKNQGIYNINLKAEPEHGNMVVTGNLEFGKAPELDIDATGLDFNIVPLFKTLDPLGNFDLQLRTKYTPDLPTEYMFVVDSSSLNLGKIDTGRLSVNGSVAMQVPPIVDWSINWNESMLRGSGQVTLDPELNCQMVNTLTEFPLSVPMGIVKHFSETDLPISGHLTGGMTMSGPLRQFTEVDTTLQITEMITDYSGARLSLTSPANLSMKHNRINISETTLTGSNAKLTTAGFIEVEGGIKLGINGNLNLDTLENLTGFLDSTSGNMVLDIDLMGSWRDPAFRGSIFIEEFYGYIPSFELWLEDYHSEIVLDQKIGKLMYLEGIAGGSYLGGEGEIGFTHVIPNLFDLSLSGDDIDFEYPRGFDTRANMALGITGRLPSLNITGDINLKNCNYTSRINYKTMIVNESRAKLSLGNNRKQSTAEANTPVFNPRFGLSIIGPDNIFIDNNLARVEMSVKLDVLGTLIKPQILGHIDVLRGDVTFMQRSFELMNASIDFADPTKIDPLISVQAGTDIDDYRVTLDVTGQLYSDINIQPSSTPPLNDLDLWNLMLIGKTRDSMSSTSDDYLASGVAYVTGSLQEQIEQRFEYWMGFDEFSIDPIMSSSDESPSAKFTVKKRFGPDLSVLYSRSASSNGDLLLIEYQISDNLYILGQKSEDNAIGVDLRYRWEFE